MKKILLTLVAIVALGVVGGVSIPFDTTVSYKGETVIEYSGALCGKTLECPKKTIELSDMLSFLIK